jgi:hypothetical protein
MKFRRFVTCCLVIAVGAAFSSAQSYSFNVQLNLTGVPTGTQLVDTYFAYDTSYTSNGPVTVVDEGSSASGDIFSGTSSSPFTSADGYTFIAAWYDSIGAEHLAIDVNTTGEAITNGQSFDSTIGALTGVTETEVLGYLSEGDAVVSSYIQDGWADAHPYLPTVGSTGIVMGFSNGTPIGTTVPTSAPEPATVISLVLGGSALLRRRRS